MGRATHTESTPPPIHSRKESYNLHTGDFGYWNMGEILQARRLRYPAVDSRARVGHLFSQHHEKFLSIHSTGGNEDKNDPFAILYLERRDVA